MNAFFDDCRELQRLKNIDSHDKDAAMRENRDRLHREAKFNTAESTNQAAASALSSTPADRKMSPHVVRLLLTEATASAIVVKIVRLPQEKCSTAIACGDRLARCGVVAVGILFKQPPPCSRCSPLSCASALPLSLQTRIAPAPASIVDVTIHPSALPIDVRLVGALYTICERAHASRPPVNARVRYASCA